jgi:Flp pilus assembly protein TadB
VTAASAAFAALAGGAAFGLARAGLSVLRAEAVSDWVSGAARGAAGALSGGGAAGLLAGLLEKAGRAQERVPALRALSGRLHAPAAAWLGADDPGSAAWLGRKEAAFLAAGAFFMWLASDPLIGAAAGIAAFFAPDLFARERHASRQARLRRELPDVLDLLTLCLEAGLSLDASFQQVAEKLQGGLLPDEMARMLGSVRFGMKRHQAWRESARRLGNPEFSEVVEALAQADAMGVGLAEALRGIAGQMRLRARSRAEEAAHKAPVKLLFPLAFFIFPAIFIVLMGPVFLQLMGAVQ